MIEITVTKSIKVVPVFSLDDVHTGQDLYTMKGMQGSVTYVDVERFDVYFSEINRTHSFVDDGIANMFWGIFREVPDYDKIYINAMAASPSEISIEKFSDLKVKDEVVIGDDVYGYVVQATDELTKVKATLPDGRSGTVILDSKSPEEFIGQIRALKLH